MGEVYMGREWKLGKDVFLEDNILDGITFEELCMTLKCNHGGNITAKDVINELNEIVEIHFQDMKYLLENNMDKIIETAQSMS